MEYRTNRRTGDRISVIGLGTSYIAETEERRRLGFWNSSMRRESTMPTLLLQTQRLLPIMGKPFHLSERICTIRYILAQIMSAGHMDGRRTRRRSGVP